MIFAGPKSASIRDLFAWAARHTEEINRFHMTPSRWPTFVNDTDASAGNLKVGQPYVTPTGEMRRRVA